MNILHINTSDDGGGAARAMHRLHTELKRAGNISRVLAGYRSSSNSDVHTIAETVTRHRRLDKPIEYIRQHVENWAGLQYWSYLSTFRIPDTGVFQGADVVNLHNLHGDYFNYWALPKLTKLKPTVWTLHDMWALTGHCAYSYDCERWISGCFSCPLLKGEARKLVEPRPTHRDMTPIVWRVKRNLYRKSILYIVTPSQWLRGLVEKSILGEYAAVECIPNGVDLQVLQPMDKALARAALDIPVTAKVLFFAAVGADHDRKGFRYLLEALDMLEADDSAYLLTVGYRNLLRRYTGKLRIRELGYVEAEELLKLCYSAADLFVFPTLADNQPLVLIEAMACGVPVISFDVGGVPEMVRHMETGYLAVYKDANDLAGGIRMLLDDSDLRSRMGRRCREIAEQEYSLELQARRYIELYQEAIDRHKSRTTAPDKK